MKALWLGCLAVALCAQEPALLNNRQVIETCQRSIQLMESTGVALPELGRSGAPLVEGARDLLANLRTNTANADLNYSLVTNLRAYVALADALPRPFSFSEEAQKQLHELRDILARVESHFRALIALKDRQLRNPDRDNLAHYTEMNSRAGPPKPGKPRVIFLGDSITDFWRLNEYFPDRDFINRGISGQITGQMLGRMESDVIRLQPSVVVLLAGTNDIARGVPLPAIEDNLAAIADLADYYKIRIILASVLPVSDYHKDSDPNYERTPARPPATIRQLNDWIKRFCATRKLTCLDYYSALQDASGFLKAELSDDGLHPNSAGYRVMAPLALAAIEKSARPEAQTPEPPKKHRLFGK